MRAAVLRDGRMTVRDDVADPTPGPGEVLVEVAACGICGSDLHFVHHGATMLEVAARMEGTVDLGRTPPDLTRDVFMGHEFSGRVLDVGPDTPGPAPARSSRPCR
jgi:threonine dehydrogenase-like Zn-dependent dehydrogenase